MKPKSERTLILAGSLFLAGLIIADVLTQHLNHLEAARKDADITSSSNASHHRASQEADSVDIQPDQELNELTLTESTSTSPSDSSPDSKNATDSIAGQSDEGKAESFGLESTPPPPVQVIASQASPDLSFNQLGADGKYQHVAASIPQTQFNIFYNALNPHGRWFRHANFGTCWIPQETQKDRQWRPYVNGGKWTYTKSGWLWHSDYRWGGYPFHYGRWFHTSKGWAWKPEGDWSTAWVSWRNAGEHCGWAPMPPVLTDVKPTKLDPKTSRTQFKQTYPSVQLGEDHFVFLQKKSLLETSLNSKILEAEKARSVFRYSKPADRFARGQGQRVGNHGIPVNKLLPWIRSAQQDQLASKTETKLNQTAQAKTRQAVATIPNNQNQFTTGRMPTMPQARTFSSQSPLNQNGQTPPITQSPSNITLTRQVQVNNIKQAEQGRLQPSSPGKMNQPLTSKSYR
ncbi:MAG: hypothetical protein HOH33_09650 [Verrucomicrobia bacterium]|jgi:hypothetical protein|nr:hypothetical protein [Verrucomicrobiota bacterium]